jgi:hypothetical protein
VYYFEVTELQGDLYYLAEVICSVVLSPLLIVRVRSRASWWGDPRTGVTRGLVEHVTCLIRDSAVRFAYRRAKSAGAHSNSNVTIASRTGRTAARTRVQCMTSLRVSAASVSCLIALTAALARG